MSSQQKAGLAGCLNLKLAGLLHLTRQEKCTEWLTRPPLLSGMGPFALLAVRRAGWLRTAILLIIGLRPRARRQSFERCPPACPELSLSDSVETLTVVRPSHTRV